MSKFSCQLEVSLAAGAFSGNLVGSIGFSDELCVSEGELITKCKSVENILAKLIIFRILPKPSCNREFVLTLMPLIEICENSHNTF